MEKESVKFNYFPEYKKLKRLKSKTYKQIRRLTPDEYADKIIKEIEWLEKYNQDKKYE